MSRPSTLSSSPIQFREAASAFAPLRFSPAASASNALNLPNSFPDRRRTSHPHNQSRASEEMADVSHAQRQQRPRLEHRASQTIIDLTDESEEPSLFVPRNPRARSRSHRPPQLGRSDASGLMEFIDLTDDNGDPDIIITGGRELSVPRQEARPAPGRQLPPLRHDSPGLFVDDEPPAAALPGMNGVFARVHAGVAAMGAAIGFAAPPRQPQRPAHHHGDFHFHAAHHVQHRLADQFPPGVMAAFLGGAVHQAMPGRMDYRHPAFAERKPEHKPPPPAREDFTRSPQEDMTIICPSCEEELIHNKEEVEEPVAKRNGKAPTRKEREEHPFWVVKDCGHTYCNKCFQNRTAVQQPDINFEEISKPASSKSKTTTKQLRCAVDACDSDVKTKDKWVGVFL
ncbi:hypothetical protein LSUE1_G008992 [Lachnellula suecica]|uniref:Cell cycle control protein n=1 Tax=Lachnellula suecica TaxID=602035 RepID=A0A8T9BXE1_9HELO|nr:hypothetical protein LSUE1_G008992 [Lachnellula suecica]